MTETEKTHPAEDSCPVGYFWNGSKCVPNTTPPPVTEEESKKKVNEDKDK